MNFWRVHYSMQQPAAGQLHYFVLNKPTGYILACLRKAPGKRAVDLLQPWLDQWQQEHKVSHNCLVSILQLSEPTAAAVGKRFIGYVWCFCTSSYAMLRQPITTTGLWRQRLLLQKSIQQQHQEQCGQATQRRATFHQSRTPATLCCCCIASAGSTASEASPPIGRLDVATSGLIFLTNDGQ